ncbi:CAMK family protein kinase [Tritrichomonas foetus]|uniref:CAMK family protein kinase n=1 Tax=Tritrichomonas foetus TaxID=1144522 RepID=A0A1J4JMJ0_9EUKA|nr:CAMK family protein kinase [Tritrichomonas foetus]|eukprot:OHT00327.1 CAMK family protein kinase [Tritrichomonas foetus]
MMNNKLTRVGSIPLFSGRQTLDIHYTKKKTMKKVNQYYLLKSIGEGSFAKVFLGYEKINKDNEEYGEYYALKKVLLSTLSKSITGISQLEQEVEIMRKLKHPNIISMKEVIHVPHQTAVYMVLQYADCGSLDDLLKMGENFSDEQIRYMFKQIVDGVNYLHENQLVHQDLKPANIMLDSSGAVLISDFSVGHSFQNAAVYVGSPAFQAPEVIGADDEDFGEYEPGKEDIWSLGVTLYLMVYGELPFPGETSFEIFTSIKNAVFERPIIDNDDGFWDLLQGMLTYNQHDRFDIKQVLQSKYVAEAQYVDLELASKAKPKPVFDPKVKAVEVKGRVCHDGYCFTKSDKSYHTMLTSQSLPFRSPFG